MRIQASTPRPAGVESSESADRPSQTCQRGPSQHSPADPRQSLRSSIGDESDSRPLRRTEYRTLLDHVRRRIGIDHLRQLSCVPYRADDLEMSVRGPLQENDHRPIDRLLVVVQPNASQGQAERTSGVAQLFQAGALGGGRTNTGQQGLRRCCTPLQHQQRAKSHRPAIHRSALTRSNVVGPGREAGRDRNHDETGKNGTSQQPPQGSAPG